MAREIIRTIKGLALEFPVEKGLSASDMTEYDNFIRDLEAAKTPKQVAAILLGLSGEVSDDESYVSSRNLKTYLLYKSEDEGFSEGDKKAYDVDREIAYTKMVNQLTGLDLPKLRVRLDADRIIDRVLAQSSLDTDDKKEFRSIIKELTDEGKLTQFALALLVTHIEDPQATDNIKESLLADQSFSELIHQLAVEDPINEVQLAPIHSQLQNLKIDTVTPASPESPSAPISPLSTTKTSRASTPGTPTRVSFRGTRPISLKINSLNLEVAPSPSPVDSAYGSGKNTPDCADDDANSPDNSEAPSPRISRDLQALDLAAPRRTNCPA